MKGSLTFLCVLVLAAMPVSGGEPLVFTGRIVPSEDKTPDEYTVCLELHEGRREQPPSTFLIETTPAPDGAFTIEAPPQPRQYTLYVRDEHGRALHGFPHLNDSRDFGDLHFRTDGAFSGMVRLPDGDPAVGTTVLLERKLEARCNHFLDAGTIDADDQGYFVFDHLNPGQYQVRTLSDTHIAEPIEVLISDSFSYIEVHLEPAVTIAGRVVFPDGQPAPGVQVRTRHARPVETGEDGRFLLSGLGAGRYRLSVYKQDLAPVGGLIPSVDLKDQDREVSDIVVAPTGSLALTLQTEPPGRELPEQLSVRLEPRPRQREWVRLSFEGPVENGVARLTGLPAGRFQLRLADETLGDAEIDIAIESGRETEAHLTLPEVYALRGRILDEAGDPVTGAFVSFQISGTPSSVGRVDGATVSRHARTDDAGRFTLQGLPRGEGALSVQAEDWAPLNETVSISSETEEPGDWVLRRGLAIAGTVTEFDGAPAAGMRVHLFGRGEPRTPRGTISRDTRVHEDGTFHFGGLPSGAYKLDVQDADTRELIHSVTDVAAGSDDLIVILGEAKTLTLRVAAPDGTELPDAEIQIARTDRGRTWQTRRTVDQLTDPEGKMSLTLRVGAAYEITAHRHPWLAARHRLDLTTATDFPETLVLTLTPGVAVAGIVVDHEDRSVAGVYVSTGEAEPVLTDEEGRFRLEGMAPGVNRLAVHQDAPRKTLLAEERFLAQEDQDPVRITLPQAGRVSGVVRSHSGEPLSEAIVFLQPSDMRSGRRDHDGHQETDMAGRFTFDPVIPGAYTLMAIPNMRDGREMDTPVIPKMRQIEVGAGETVEADLIESKTDGLTIAGIVTLDGQPLADVQVVALPVDGDDALGSMRLMGQTPIRTDAEGRFELVDVEPGEHMLLLARDTHPLMPMAAGADALQYRTSVFLHPDRVPVQVAVSSAGLTGVVEDPQGQPVSGANLNIVPVDTDAHLLHQWIFGRQTESDAEGRFSIPYLDVDDYRVTVVEEDLQLVTVQTLAATDDGQEHRIRLAPGLSVTGSVTVEGGELPENVWVFVYCEAGQLKGGDQADSDGAYTVAPLPPGRYLLFALAEDYSVGGARLAIEEDTVEDFVLSPSGTVAVTVRGPEALRSGRTVRIEDEQGREVIRVRQTFTSTGFWGMFAAVFLGATDSQGKIVIDGLPAGGYRVFLEDQEVSANVTVVPLQTAAVTLNLAEE